MNNKLTSEYIRDQVDLIAWKYIFDFYEDTPEGTDKILDSLFTLLVKCSETIAQYENETENKFTKILKNMLSS